MGLVLKSIDDPRDALEKATRTELYKFAKANNVAEIDSDGMPATLMRQILRGKGLTRIVIPPRVLGKPEPRPNGMLNSNGRPIVPEKGVEADATADLMRQYQAQRAAPPPPPENKREAWKAKTVDEMSVNELRWACKANEIKLTRKSTMPEMRQSLKDKGLS